MARVDVKTMLLPGPDPSPIWGWRSNLRALQRDPLMYLRQLHARYGAVAAITQTQSPVVAVFSATLVEALLEQAVFDSPTLHVAPHSNFTPHVLQAYYDATVRATHDVVARWRVGQLVDLVYVARRIMARSTLAGLTGQADLADDVVHDIARRVPHWLRATLATPLRQRTVPRGGVLRGPHAFAKLHATFASLVAASSADAPFHHWFAPSDVVDGILMLVAFLCEMTALAIGWTLLLVEQHVGALNDLVAELRTVLGNAPPTREQVQDTSRLPLLDGAIKESLRMLPPIAVSVRVSKQAWSVPSVHVPASATVLYSPYLVQRMSEFFYAPDRFRPQRWSQIEPPPIAFTPLGIDPLAGWALPFVIEHAKLVLASMLQQYTVALAAGMAVNRVRSTTLLAPQPDVVMVIMPRDRAAPRREVQGNVRDVVQFP